MARVPTRGCAWSSDSLVGSCLRLLKAFPLLVPPRSWNYHPKSSFPLGFAGGWGGNLDAFHATETLLPDLTWRSCPGCRINCRNRPSDPKWGGRWGPSLGLLPAGGGGGGRVRWVGGCQPHSSSLDEDAVQGVWRLLQEGTPSLLSSIPFLLPSNGVPPPHDPHAQPKGSGVWLGPCRCCHPPAETSPKTPSRESLREPSPSQRGAHGREGVRSDTPLPPKRAATRFYTLWRSPQMVGTLPPPPRHLPSPSLAEAPSDGGRGWRDGGGSPLPPLELAKRWMLPPHTPPLLRGRSRMAAASSLPPPRFCPLPGINISAPAESRSPPPASCHHQ